MNKKISLGAAVAFCLIVVTATLSAALIFSMRAYNSKLYDLPEREKMYDKVAEVDGQVRQNYIGDVVENDLRDALAEGYLAGTGDKYAEYYDAATYKRMKEGYGDRNVQIGILTKMDESGYMLVTEVYPESPAQATGIQPGDLIVRIDDEDITAENYADTAFKLYGEAGTKMTIILRKGVIDSSMEMTRRFVEVPTVSALMLPDKIALVKIKEFNDVTPDQFTKIVDRMIDEGALGFVFDVRNVNTATLYSVARTLDKLVPEGVIASSIDKNDETKVLEYSDERQVTMPMAVMANERTEGEAELFAADIRDFGKGMIVGAKTVGKGTIQTTVPLNDGSAIRLTTARINSKSGVTYDGAGVKPDFEVKMTEEQSALAQSNKLDGDLQLKVENDPQLRRAVEVVLTGVRAAEAAASSSAAELSGKASSAESSSGKASSAESSSGKASSAESSSGKASSAESSSGKASSAESSSGKASSAESSSAEASSAAESSRG